MIQTTLICNSLTDFSLFHAPESRLITLLAEGLSGCVSRILICVKSGQIILLSSYILAQEKRPSIPIRPDLIKVAVPLEAQ